MPVPDNCGEDGAGYPAVSAALAEQILTIPAERCHGAELCPPDGASIAGGAVRSRPCIIISYVEYGTEPLTI